MSICPICKTDHSLPVSADNPSWLEDPIPTPSGALGVKGVCSFQRAQLDELRAYWTYIAGRVGVTVPTSFFKNARLSGLSRDAIVDLRIVVEACLSKLGHSISDYFKSDKYGNVYTTTQLDWTDVDRSSGAPQLQRKVSIRAVHLEELRRGILPALLPEANIPKKLTVDSWLIGSTWRFEFSGVCSTPSGGTVTLFSNASPLIVFPTILQSDPTNFKIRIEIADTYMALGYIRTYLNSCLFKVGNSTQFKYLSFGRYATMYAHSGLQMPGAYYSEYLFMQNAPVAFSGSYSLVMGLTSPVFNLSVTAPDLASNLNTSTYQNNSTNPPYDYFYKTHGSGIPDYSNIFTLRRDRTAGVPLSGVVSCVINIASAEYVSGAYVKNYDFLLTLNYHA